MRDIKDYYKNKRVLVTGADGFMGSFLTERLVEYGAKTSIYIRGNSVTGTALTTLRKIPHLEDKLDRIITGDIGSSDAISLIKANKPEIIFHLAADAYVPNSFDHPVEVLETNVIGTLNVLQASRDLKDFKRVVCTSSSEIYGTAITAPISEDHPLNPTSPYAASKVAADRYSFSFYTTYGLPVAIIRPFNTFGPRHTYDVIPKFIRLALEGKPLTIYGTGDQTRDFTYVDDMVDAFLCMGFSDKVVGQAVNFGTGRDVSVRYTAEKILEFTQTNSKITYIEKRMAEVNRLICDYSKAEKLCGWKPKFTFEEGLERNIEWAQKHLSQG